MKYFLAVFQNGKLTVSEVNCPGGGDGEQLKCLTGEFRLLSLPLLLPPLRLAAIVVVMVAESIPFNALVIMIGE